MTAPSWRCSRSDDLAHGWLGNAWVWLELTGTGTVSGDEHTWRRLASDLRRQLEVSPGVASSCLVGCAASAVVAASGTARRPVFRSLLERALARCREPLRAARELDVMRGAAGALLAFAEIEARVPGVVPHELVRRAQRGVCRHLARGEPLLGLAHGLAGYVLALEMTHHVFGIEFPRGLRRRGVDALAAARLRAAAAAAFWPARAGVPELAVQGWCHGAPGIGLALLCCARLRPRCSAYAELAREALEAMAMLGLRSPTFCCGSVGHAMILLEAGGARFAARAHAIAASLATLPRPRDASFHKGRLGIAYLQHRVASAKPLPLPGLGIFSVSDCRAGAESGSGPAWS